MGMYLNMCAHEKVAFVASAFLSQSM